MTHEAPIPVNVLTGFLGSGKTTLLRNLLANPAFSDAAVLINEFGEAGLDHLLLRQLDQSTLLLESGCICCTIRDDLNEAIRTLYAQRQKGSVPRFRRILIETTGLADPTPILATIMAEPMIRHHFRLGNVIACVDAVNAPDGLARHPELRKQVAVADRLALTKVDLVEVEAVPRLVQRLKQINPTAIVRGVVHGNADASLVLGQDVFDPETKAAEVRSWLAHHLDHPHHGSEPHAHVPAESHGAETRAFTIELSEPVEWSAFGLWLSLIASRHGERLLRLKGILNVEGSDSPVVVHGVQQLIHPPEHLDAWPFPDRRSRIIIIGEGLPADLVERSLHRFLSLGARIRESAE